MNFQHFKKLMTLHWMVCNDPMIIWELAMACLLKTPPATTAARKVEAGKSQRDWEQLAIDIGTRWDMGRGW